MSQAAPALKEVSQEAQTAQAPQAPVLSTLQQYEVQLNMFKQQKEAVKVQFHQLEGAIFALEQMINQHKESLKQDVAKLAQDAAAKALKPNENQGEINDGKVDEQAKKQAPQK
jgi:hypothetical protein